MRGSLRCLDQTLMGRLNACKDKAVKQPKVPLFSWDVSCLEVLDPFSAMDSFEPLRRHKQAKAWASFCIPEMVEFC